MSDVKSKSKSKENNKEYIDLTISKPATSNK
jgi:hypothetical protein